VTMMVMMMFDLVITAALSFESLWTVVEARQPLASI